MLRRSALALDAYRQQGISYLQSLHVTSAALHKCVKEAKQAKFSKHSAPGYHSQIPDGQGGFEKVNKLAKTVEEIAH
jgi:hypothetical protein